MSLTDPTSQPNRDGPAATALGFALILAGMILLFFGVRAAFRLFQPPPSSVALSAYFVTTPPLNDPNAREYAATHIRIHGDVYKQAQAVQNGVVRINVATADRKFDESVSTPLVNGRFQLEDPALNYIRPDFPVTITAYVLIDKTTETATIQLNTDSPTTRLAIYTSVALGLLIVSAWFVIAFTGRQTPGKNRAAIILSYFIIVLFLGVPILAPVMLIREFPDAVGAMVGVPAGLVVTCTSSQEPKQHQWALNIGGYSFVPQGSTAFAVTPVRVATAASTAAAAGPLAKVLSSAAPQKAAVDAQQPSSSPDSAASSGTTSAPTSTTADAAAPTAPSTAGSNTASTTSPSTASTPATSPLSSLSLIPPSFASTPGDCRDFSPLGQGVVASPTLPLQTATPYHGGQLTPPLVEVQGGLVVPLYVIILSVIGGAINMTRKVPGFQKQDEAAQDRDLGPVSYLGTKVIDSVKNMMGQASAEPASGVPASETHLADQAEKLDGQITSLVNDQLHRRNDTTSAAGLILQLLTQMQDLYARRDDQHPLPFKSYEDWLASHPHLREALGGSWRVELLNQYMYLISAPFLAIVTYYLLDLLGLSKPGVVVVLSFSVGLVSEKIVSWILGIASGYLQQTPVKT